MKKQKRPARPDEFFKIGALELARFGKNVHMKSSWPDGTQEEFRNAMIQNLPTVVAEIQTCVAEVAGLISRYNPLYLMRKAFGDMLSEHMSSGEEVAETEDSLNSLYVLEYVQNIIASCNSTEGENDKICDSDWDSLKKAIALIYKRITRIYLLCDSARRKHESESDDDVESFRFQAQLHWMAVRGKRYTVHEERNLRDLLLCHDQSIRSVFGISAEEIVLAVSNILNSLMEGMGKSTLELIEFDKEILEGSVGAINVLGACKNEDEARSAIQKIITERNLEDCQANILNRLYGFDLFDIELITGLKPAFLRQLSWCQGEDSDFFSDGEFSGWPLRITPLSKRPFLHLGDKYYCFNAFGLMDNIYRIIEKIVFKASSEAKQSWIDARKNNSEKIPLQYFRALLPGCRTFKEVYYKWFSRLGSPKKNWCETDGLIIYGDHLIILEIKAGSFTYTSPGDDFDAHVASIKNLVMSPAQQGERFSEFLKSSDRIVVYDCDKITPLEELRSSDFRKITICALSIDSFTEIAAQIQHLKPLGIRFGPTPVWSISLDDLRVCSEIFANPLIFLHYLEQRMSAFESKNVNVNDELEHVGLYFAFNNYSLEANDMHIESGAEITFNGYRSKIDAYFHDKQFQSGLETPFKQDIPLQIAKLIDFCSKYQCKDNVALASYLLDCDQKSRNDLSEGISKILMDQPVRLKYQFMSTSGDVRLSVACWQDWLMPPQEDRFIFYAKTHLVCWNERDRNLLQIYFNKLNAITHFSWTKITSDELTEQERERLSVSAGKLKSLRVKRAMSQKKKIPRNAKCPCHSGKKFKHCCGRTT